MPYVAPYIAPLGSELLRLKQEAVTGRLEITAKYEPSRGTPFCDIDNYNGNDVIYQTLITYTVPANHEFNLHEIEFTRDAGGHAEYRLTIAGDEMFAGLNPTQNVGLPFSPNKLFAGDIILLEVRSDDGTGIDVDGSITGDVEAV